MIRVGVTGGIGSGKSTVCRLFAERGVPVYDSDSEAKRLMGEDPSLRAALVEAFGDETFRDGVLNRRYLAATVFGDRYALARLEALVHPCVKRDSSGGPPNGLPSPTWCSNVRFSTSRAWTLRWIVWWPSSRRRSCGSCV